MGPSAASPPPPHSPLVCAPGALSVLLRLLARSALHYGAQAGHRWATRVTDLACVGTPHHGAPLERAGHWVHHDRLDDFLTDVRAFL